MSKIIKTAEFASKDIYRTHYFKASYEEIKTLYLEILKELNYNIISVDDDYLEIYAETPYMSVISKIIMQTPKETSIDFEIVSEFLFGFSLRANTFIKYVHKKIEEKYELKGLSLHKVA